MSGNQGPWTDGQRAWSQLVKWHDDDRGRRSASGDAALEAMADIGTLRRVLDQAELAAVRTARRDRRSWAEIATQLGITRQSAWERWRELDDSAPPVVPTADEGTETPGPEARAARRHAKITVPNVVGMTWDDARADLIRAGLDGTAGDPDGPPSPSLGWRTVIVVAQVPEAGAKLARGSYVRLWIGRGGGGSAGVREPRRPHPAPQTGYERRDELTGEAVG